MTAIYKEMLNNNKPPSLGIDLPRSDIEKYEQKNGICPRWQLL